MGEYGNNSDEIEWEAGPEAGSGEVQHNGTDQYHTANPQTVANQ